MKRNIVALLCALAVASVLACAGCSSSSTASSSAQQDAASSVSEQSAAVSASSAQAQQPEASAAASALENGEYLAKFNTDSSMFHVNEADDGVGTLTVSGDDMTIHVRLVSKKIVNLYAGTADEAQASPNDAIEPTSETVTYRDGYEEEVYAYDIPVPALDQDFDVAILGEKGKWYDHKVSVTDPIQE